MTKDKALKLALEYVDLVPDDRYNAEHIDREALVTAIKEALAHDDDEDAIIIQYHEATIKILEKRIEELTAQPEQEPVAWVWKDMRGQDIVSLFEPRLNSVPLYTTPPQRPWVGLTDEDITKIDQGLYPTWKDEVQAIEAKLKEKNTCQE